MKHKNFNSVYPYGYVLTRLSDNMKYVGVRYANVKKNLTPLQDFGKVYFTSGKLKREFKRNPENFKFRITYTFDNMQDMWEWEKKIVLRVYARPDFANGGWSTNFGDNPDIGKLISEGRNKIRADGKTSIERGAETLVDWIWNTEDGERYRQGLSERSSARWAGYSEEDKQKIKDKRSESMDFKAAAQKARITKLIVGEDGLTTYERGARKAAITARLNGSASENGRYRNELLNMKLGEMSEEEFENFCEGKPKRSVSGWTTRRNKYISSRSNETA